ncbi:MAG: hypothetical protein IJ215_01355 [Clostridia bacterium]|nr:hypothetical protein [Clostridia bacterium]
MIKKILALVVIVLALYSFYGCFVNGQATYKLGGLSYTYKAPAYQEIKKQKETLESDQAKLDMLNDSGIKNAVASVEDEIKNYEAKKQAYDMLALTASRADIAEANKEEKYLLDYLWIKVGNYAADNNVKFKMTPNDEDSSLTFDITGSYISVINFIYDLQNDGELDFAIDGVVVQGGQTVKANFRVENVDVVTSPENI